MKLPVLVALLGLVPAGTGMGADKVFYRGSEAPIWRAQGELATPVLSGETPPVSAGCVVIGHHILADGSSAKPRILKAAFTTNVDTALRDTFSADALEAAKRWRFTSTDPETAIAQFHLETVGFVPATESDPRVVVGISSQIESLRGICEIADLAAWGEQNAIPVEQAKAQNADKVIVSKKADPPGLYWSMRGEISFPKYPVAAAQQGINACVVVGYTIGSDGAVSGLKLISSAFSDGASRSVREAFENSAAAAVATRRFSPGPDNLGRVAQFLQSPMTFYVDDAAGVPDDCNAPDFGGLIPASGS